MTATPPLTLTVQTGFDGEDEGEEPPSLPSTAAFEGWVAAALLAVDYPRAVELTVRIVGEAEGAALNQTYRHQVGPTNVLAFPLHLPADVTQDYLGDIAICAPLVSREAAAQGKALEAHWAHLVVHGTLHLLGYDHDTDSRAAAMEALESRIISSLGHRNPYGDDESCIAL
ncbi:MAG: rRNA maturation RNase YbeY [Candidatus Competibacterales bacterium]